MTTDERLVAARSRAHAVVEAGHRMGSELVRQATTPDGIDGLRLIVSVGLVLEVLERENDRDRKMFAWPRWDTPGEPR